MSGFVNAGDSWEEVSWATERTSIVADRSSGSSQHQLRTLMVNEQLRLWICASIACPWI